VAITTRSSERRPPPVVAVVGPTATGKSGLALDLAERLGGEIVNADALQLYRGMDIGTAKVRHEDRRGIPHHQLDVLSPREEASVAAYQREARADVARIRDRGGVAILVGGSGLYLRAALDRLEIPPTDPAVRRRLEEQLALDGVASLAERLRVLDPEAASRIEPNNARRLVRALEVVELTGRPFAAAMPARHYLLPTVTLGLNLERTELDLRIGRRVRLMWEAGLAAEARSLLAQGLREGRTASRGLGYSQALEHLDGVLTAAQAQELTTTATCRYARRQLSWFRPDPRITWLPADAPQLLDEALRVINAEALSDNGRHG